TLPGFSSVIASDQTSRLALMTQSGSTCAQIVDVSALTVLKELGSCGIAQASFEQNGEAVAGIVLASEDRSGRQRFVLAATTSQLGGEANVDGAFQTWWRGSEGGARTILVLSEPDPNTVTITQCVEAEQLCS